MQLLQSKYNLELDINIIILNDYASVQGGAAKVAIESAIGLAEAGNNVTFIFGCGSLDYKLGNTVNVNCINLKQQDLISNPSKVDAAITGLWNRDVENKLSDIFNDFDPITTVVHIHSWVKSLSISAVSVATEYNFPMVLTLHDYFSVCPNGGYYNYKKQKVCELIPMSTSCFFSNCDSRNYQQKVWRFFRQKIYKFADFPRGGLNFITVSDFSESFIKSYLTERASFWRVPNPITTHHLPASDPSSSNIFTFIGRISPEKGVLLLTKLKFIPQEQLRFIGTGELENTLKEMLPQAEFLGWCDNQTIIDKLGDTRALLFTSQWYETQGLVVLEAAARGIPSIVSDATAAQEFIINGETGLIFESGNVNDLEENIIKLDGDDVFVRKMGSKAYDSYWDDPPTLRKHVDGLISCYQHIIETRNS